MDILDLVFIATAISALEEHGNTSEPVRIHVCRPQNQAVTNGLLLGRTDDIRISELAITRMYTMLNICFR